MKWERLAGQLTAGGILPGSAGPGSVPGQDWLAGRDAGRDAGRGAIEQAGRRGENGATGCGALALARRWLSGWADQSGRGDLAFLRIPPFPGHRAGPLVQDFGDDGQHMAARAQRVLRAVAGALCAGRLVLGLGRLGQPPAVEDAGRATDSGLASDDDATVFGLISALRSAQVGGAFWGAWPDWPQGRDIVLAPDTQAQARAMAAQVTAQGLAGRAVMLAPGRGGMLRARSGRGGSELVVLRGAVDPWYVAERAREVRAGAGQELALVAALAGKPLAVMGHGRFAGLDGTEAGLAQMVRRELLGGRRYVCVFSGQAISAAAAVGQLAAWRRGIDANRQLAAVLGVARWKRRVMAPLLWAGRDVPWARRAGGLGAGARALVWAARVPGRVLAGLAARGVALGEVEDGFIRSAGLGANCVPPLSVIVDGAGAHFDPARENGLERMLAMGDFSPDLLARAAALRARLVAAGICKYAQGTPLGAERQPIGGRRRVLVVGQVEDDRAMLLGGAGMTNRALLMRARAMEPDAELIYRPHPDVEAGHRIGAIPDAEVRRLADRIERERPIAALLDEVDGLHVISSLAGFEALCRGCAVTTHGVPFYAGWGLTRDMAAMPDRRGRARSIDEVVAAALILYPRYLDPVTRLPCPVEVLVERMAAGQAGASSPLVWWRRGQGALAKWVGGWTGKRGSRGLPPRTCAAL